MECQAAQEEILDSFEEAKSAGRQQELEAHLAECRDCAGFAARQKALDARLTQLLTTPQMSPAFRSALGRKIRREGAPFWSEALPDVLHFAGCGAATVLSAVVLPYAPSMVFAVGAAAALLTFLPLTAMRSLFAHSELER